MKVADGFEPGAVIGPLIDMKAVEKVEAHIGDALKKGAKIVIGGEGDALGGRLFGPPALPELTTDMQDTREKNLPPPPPPSPVKTQAWARPVAHKDQHHLPP